MPEEKWGSKKDPRLFAALFNAFGILNQPLLTRIKLKNVKDCKSLDELIVLICDTVTKDKNTSKAQASVCTDYGQDVKAIHRTSNRMLSTLGNLSNVVHYTDGTSEEMRMNFTVFHLPLLIRIPIPLLFTRLLTTRRFPNNWVVTVVMMMRVRTFKHSLLRLHLIHKRNIKVVFHTIEIKASA